MPRLLSRFRSAWSAGRSAFRAASGVAPGSADPATAGGHPVIRRPDPRKAYAAGGLGGHGFGLGGGANRATVLSQTFDDAERHYGSDTLRDLMLNDPDISSSLRVRSQWALAGRDDVRAQNPERDEKLANEIAGAFSEMLANMRRPWKDASRWMMEASWAYGNKPAELIWDRDPGSGRLDVVALKPLPRRSYSYVVDATGEDVGLLIPTVDATGHAILPRNARPAKYARLTYDERDGDPRGNDLLAGCYRPWNIKVQLYPEWFQFCVLNGRPSTFARFAPEVLSSTTFDLEAEGAKLDELRAGGTMAAVAEEIGYIEAKGDGQIYGNLLEDCTRQIVRHLILAPRATVEAQYASKADSETSLDIVNNLIASDRAWIARFWEWWIAYPWVAANWDERTAAYHTPTIVMADTKLGEAMEFMAALTPMLETLDRKQFKAGFEIISDLTGKDFMPDEDLEAIREEREREKLESPPPPAGGPPMNGRSGDDAGAPAGNNGDGAGSNNRMAAYLNGNGKLRQAG